MATIKRELHPEEAHFLSSAFPQFVKNNGTNFPVTGLAYDASGTETAYWKLQSLNYGSGNLTLNLYWYADTASSGDVKFESAIAAITPNTDTQDVETKAFATATNATDTHLGTTGQRLHQIAITISNLDSVAANDIVWLKIARLGADVADTMTGDAILVLAELEYSDT